MTLTQFQLLGSTDELRLEFRYGLQTKPRRMSFEFLKVSNEVVFRLLDKCPLCNRDHHAVVHRSDLRGERFAEGQLRAYHCDQDFRRVVGMNGGEPPEGFEEMGIKKCLLIGEVADLTVRKKRWDGKARSVVEGQWPALNEAVR